MAGPTLPDRITVPTCIACGAMGREERCFGECSEHRLPLIAAADFDALQAAARSAQAELALLEPIVRTLVHETPPESSCPEAYRALRGDARLVLERVPPRDRHRDWSAPDRVVGWWCAECGNVDAPQPCLGVCIWRPLEWVSASSYAAEHARSAGALRGAEALVGLLARLVSVRPKSRRCAQTWAAFRAHALEVSAGIAHGA